jgi:Fe-S-cluster-containing dehydrogenase component
MAEKPIPQALYGCHFCSEECSYYANELFWSEVFQAWVCASCWDKQDKHWDHDTGLCCKYGLSLEKELDNRIKLICSYKAEV